jgi:transcriptional regulator with XRE-family HTH domain
MFTATQQPPTTKRNAMTSPEPTTGRPSGRPPKPTNELKKREHGTRARYLFGLQGDDTKNGCRCVKCFDAAWTYEKQRLNRKRKGIEPFIDAKETREHLIWLRSEGVGRRTIAEVSGVAVSQVWKILKGRTTRIRPATAERLLAVHLGKRKPGALLDDTKARELVQQMLDLGHTKAELANMLGLSHHTVRFNQAGKITQKRMTTITELHRSLTAQQEAHKAWNAERQRDYRQRRNAGQVTQRNRTED